MGMEGRPYSPETLAERWGCTPSHVRKMVRRGDLRAFRLGGKLLRIPAVEVERIEAMDPCEDETEAQESHGSPNSEAATPSSGTTIEANGIAARLARLTPAPRRPVSLNTRTNSHD